MLISTKGRYALRVLLELAEHNDGSYMTLRDIAGRQEISEKYLESIIGILSRAGYVKAVRGRGGGYKLARPAETYTGGSILKLTEGSLASVSCLGTEQNGCSRAGQCKTLPLWTNLDQLFNDFLESITLADLLQENTGSEADIKV